MKLTNELFTEIIPLFNTTFQILDYQRHNDSKHYFVIFNIAFSVAQKIISIDFLKIILGHIVLLKLM